MYPRQVSSSREKPTVRRFCCFCDEALDMFLMEDEHIIDLKCGDLCHEDCLVGLLDPLGPYCGAADGNGDSDAAFDPRDGLPLCGRCFAPSVPAQEGLLERLVTRALVKPKSGTGGAGGAGGSSSGSASGSASGSVSSTPTIPSTPLSRIQYLYSLHGFPAAEFGSLRLMDEMLMYNRAEEPQGLAQKPAAPPTMHKTLVLLYERAVVLAAPDGGAITGLINLAEGIVASHMYNGNPLFLVLQMWRPGVAAPLVDLVFRTGGPERSLKWMQALSVDSESADRVISEHQRSEKRETPQRGSPATSGSPFDPLGAPDVTILFYTVSPLPRSVLEILRNIVRLFALKGAEISAQFGFAAPGNEMQFVDLRDRKWAARLERIVGAGGVAQRGAPGPPDPREWIAAAVNNRTAPPTTVVAVADHVLLSDVYPNASSVPTIKVGFHPGEKEVEDPGIYEVNDWDEVMEALCLHLKIGFDEFLQDR